MSGFYILVYFCSNCATRYNVSIKYGQEAFINLTCPNCGVNCCNPERKPEKYALDGFALKGERIVKL